MTARAAEVFAQVKTLTRDERAQLTELMNELPVTKEPVLVKTFVMPDYAARLKEDFPGGIVIEDSQAFWDEARAERIDFLR